MKNKDHISFGLRKISTEQFAIIESAFDKSTENIELANGLRFGFDIENRIISVLVSANFNQDKGPFLLIEISCHFEIDKEQWGELNNIDASEIELPMELARHLVMLSIGTLRGVLHAKTENTPFNMFFLPTINVNDLVKEDITMKVDIKNENTQSN